jgi:hypothetical protein
VDIFFIQTKEYIEMNKKNGNPRQTRGSREKIFLSTRKREIWKRRRRNKEGGKKKKKKKERGEEE